MRDKSRLNLSTAETEALLLGGESDRVEFKESLHGKAPDTIREAICAFANDLPNHELPGVVLVGVRDNGTLAGLPVTDDLLRQLAAMRTDGNIVPPPTMSVAKHTIRGQELAVVMVAPSDSPPVSCRGRIYVRIGPRRAIATAQDERILTEKRRFKDRPFDIRPCAAAALADLDRMRFEYEYLPSAVAPDILEANDRTYEQRLAATKLIVTADDPTPTNLGVMVIGKRTRSLLPGCYVQFLRLDGIDINAPIVDEEVIDGTVLDIARRLEEKFVAHNRAAVNFTSQQFEVRSVDYPLVALQQIARNALLHRTYEGTNSPVRVTWYNDRIEFFSPGGPYGNVTVHNFGRRGLTDYRNPNLAEAMRVLGLVQRFGFGLVSAESALKQNGNPPLAFEIDNDYVLVVMKPAP